MKNVAIWTLLGTMVFFLNFQPAHADLCPLAKEMAVKSLKAFDKDPKKGLSGLIQARKLCPGDREIAYNLELGKGDEAASWAEKAGRVSPGDPNVAALTMEVMFSRGKYAETLAYAQKNRSHLPAETVKKAAEYATEAQWNTFRKGRKEQAAQEMLKPSQRYPSDRTSGYSQGQDGGGALKRQLGHSATQTPSGPARRWRRMAGLRERGFAPAVCQIYHQTPQ